MAHGSNIVGRGTAADSQGLETALFYWQSFLALEPLDEDLPRIRDNGETRDPFCGWNTGKATEK